MTAAAAFQDRDLRRKLKAILILRAVILTLFLGLIYAFLSRIRFPLPIGPLSAVVGLAFALSLVYALILKLSNDPWLLGVIQVTGDLAIVVGILYTTGGIESPFSFLNILVIIASSLLLSRTACFITASIASILYGLLLDLEYYSVIQPIYFFPKTGLSYVSGYIFYILFLNISAYYFVAYLASVLSQRLDVVRRELLHKSTDLAKLEALHKDILQNMSDGLWSTDLAGRITSCNAAAEPITGYPAAESAGRFAGDLLPLPDLRALFQSAGPRPALPLQTEGECPRKDGRLARIRMKISRLIEPGGQMRGYICVFEDLTALRNMEKKMALAEKMAEVGKISAGLAHEIRNPLASLSGSIQMLYKNLNPEDVASKSLMEIVLRETGRLNSFLSDFLGYADPGKSRRAHVDLAAAIEDIITLLKNNPEYKEHIRVEFTPASAPLHFTADERQFKQIVWNLCLNGIQAMKQGGTLTITIGHVREFSHGRYHSHHAGVLLTVRDEGCGIPPGKEREIFEPFFTTKERGTGLGLAKVCQMINQNDGYIGVESEPSRGTVFKVFLPEIIAPEATPAA